MLYRATVFIAIFAIGASLPSGAGVAVAQSGKSGGSALRSRTPSGGVIKTSQKPGAATTKSKDSASPAAKGLGDKPGAEASSKKPASTADWIRDNLWLVLGVPLGAAVLGFSWFFLVGRRRQGAGEDLFPGSVEKSTAPGGHGSDAASGGFSSTRIRAEDVKTRLSGSVVGEEVETDQDYALVVEEDALSATDELEEGSVDEVLASLLGGEDFEAAYEIYSQHIEEDRSLRFDAGMEKELGEKPIQGGQDESAARVLEHHVETHPAEQIEAETYFNLGYLHYRASHIDKSRKYFSLFVELEPNETRRDRAGAILSAIDARRDSA